MFAFFESPVQLLIVGTIVLLLFGNRLPSGLSTLRQAAEHFRRLPPYEQTRVLGSLERQEKRGIPLELVIIGVMVVIFLAGLFVRAH